MDGSVCLVICRLINTQRHLIAISKSEKKGNAFFFFPQPCSWSPCGHPGKPHLKTHKHRLVFSPLPPLLESNRGESKYHNENCQQEAGAMSTLILRGRKMAESGERQKEGNPGGEKNVGALRRAICLKRWKPPRQ